jgi:hypothetical protein
LFASSVLNLAELVALRQDLLKTKKIIYFHENQLTYPVRLETTRNKKEIENKKQRDFQYGYNQVLTSLVADQLLFNSRYNMSSFLDNINKFMKQIPNFDKIDIKKDIEPKCSVLYFPINIEKDFIDKTVIEVKLNQMIEANLDKAAFESETKKFFVNNLRVFNCFFFVKRSPAAYFMVKSMGTRQESRVNL